MRLEIWVEKDALSTVVSRAAQPYRIVVSPSRGYSSYSSIKDSIDERFAEQPEKPTVILLLSDCDPSGLDIKVDLEKRFDKYAEWLDITVKRIALTFYQVRQYNLIPNPVKSADTHVPKYIEQFGDACYELDAIDPVEFQRLVTTAIEAHVDMTAWNQGIRREQKERDEIGKWFENLDL